VILFIDRLPFHSWIDYSSTPPQRKWFVALPVLLTDVNVQHPPPDTPPQRWVMDTAFTGDAFAWRSHLLDADLDPNRKQAGMSRTRSPLGSTQLPVRAAALWLVSNTPALRGKPFRLVLDPGITFRNVPQRPDRDADSPLIGLRALMRAGLRVQIDFARATVSLWTPGLWYQGIWLLLRRTLSGYATVPMPWQV
jgi:hypothetical protein